MHNPPKQRRCNRHCCRDDQRGSLRAHIMRDQWGHRRCRRRCSAIDLVWNPLGSISKWMKTSWLARVGPQDGKPSSSPYAELPTMQSPIYLHGVPNPVHQQLWPWLVSGAASYQLLGIVSWQPIDNKGAMGGTFRRWCQSMDTEKSLSGMRALGHQNQPPDGTKPLRRRYVTRFP